ncbi:hypothetical protein Smp_128470 [Schistosoma mansoni]|uniref:hypothetical protein n=1 Tax=Schistosoma mansoni TaxID=6183 RepID=UPI00022DCA76|nr:hypothetical protein Smp_128470 [Schistosoma mansoni]|eukprot:XP_018654524.1 hypothetical protein Smp_128470 [Schistosoma mansoni]
MVLANFMASYIVESIVDGVSFRRRIRRIRRALFPRRVERKAYERIREEIDRSAGVWLPLLRYDSLQALPRDLFEDGDVDLPDRPGSRQLSSEVFSDTDIGVDSGQSEVTDRRQLPHSSTDGDIYPHKVVDKSSSNQMRMYLYTFSFRVSCYRKREFTFEKWGWGKLLIRKLSVDYIFLES